MNGIAKLGAALLVSGVATVQAQASAAAAQSPCTEAMWSDYNACLMSTTCELLKYLCDIQYVVDLEKCLWPKA